MSTAVVSGRVDESVKRVVDARLRREGLTAAEVISAVWGRIAETGEVPIARSDGRAEKKREAGVRLAELRERAPLGTPLATMGDADIERELERRD